MNKKLPYTEDKLTWFFTHGENLFDDCLGKKATVKAAYAIKKKTHKVRARKMGN